MLIQWTPELSVDNASLDAEHQEWIRLLNEFYIGLKSGEPNQKLEILITGMINYTNYHFANEEKYMTTNHFPDFESHKEKHELYVAKLKEYHDKIKEGKLVISIEVTNYLKSWLLNHIKGSDQQYARFINKAKH
jgi:hemerythrin